MNQSDTTFELVPVPPLVPDSPPRFVFIEGATVFRFKNGLLRWDSWRIREMMDYADFRRADILHPWNRVAILFPYHTLSEVRAGFGYHDAWNSWAPSPRSGPRYYTTLLWFPGQPAQWDCFGDPRGRPCLTVTVFTAEYFAAYDGDIMGAMRDLVYGQLGIAFDRYSHPYHAPWANLTQLFERGYVTVPATLPNKDDIAQHVVVIHGNSGEPRAHAFTLPRTVWPPVN